MKKYITIFLIIFIHTSCISINTEDADKAFKLWTQIPLDNNEVKAIKGRYWRSAHFTLEYEAYLKLIVSDSWWNELISFNELHIDTSEWILPDNLPNWFIPDTSYQKFSSDSNLNLKVWLEGDTIFIYDQQL